MLQTALVTPGFITAGWCIFMRRRSWRMRCDRVLTLAMLFQIAGLLLCMPARGRWLGNALFAITGVAHVRDYFGHLCFIAATACILYTVACRLVPANQIETAMRRVEYPATAGALIMLTCLTSSSRLTAWHGHNDFFNEPCDGWLQAYWITYAGTIIYLLGYLVRLLLVLRRSRESRRSATLFIIAIIVGTISIAAFVTRVLDPTLGVPPALIWGPLSASIGIAALTSAWSWRNTLRWNTSPRPAEVRDEAKRRDGERESA